LVDQVRGEAEIIKDPEEKVSMPWSVEGYLSWSRHERVSDRYGTVLLFEASLGGIDGPGDEPIHVFTGVPVLHRRRLVAEVLEQTKSEHIGDLSRGIGPPKGGTPVGERVVLGEGLVFLAERDTYLGLKPTDGRASDWLDPKALYRVHSHKVRLVLEEIE
jgi:hypothetical protein